MTTLAALVRQAREQDGSGPGETVYVVIRLPAQGAGSEW